MAYIFSFLIFISSHTKFAVTQRIPQTIANISHFLSFKTCMRQDKRIMTGRLCSSYGSNTNGDVTPSDSISSSNDKSLLLEISLESFATIFYSLTNVMSGSCFHLVKTKWWPVSSKMTILLSRLFATKFTTEQIIAIFGYFMV